MRKILLFVLTIILMGSITITAFATQDAVTDESRPRLVDEAGLLSVSEAEELSEKLNEISMRRQLDVVVVTVNSLEGKSPMAFADDFYDYGGYGMGSDRDGILLLVSMESRDWWMSTSGFGITAFTDAGLDYISEGFLPYLSDGKYKRAFDTYADLCDEFAAQAREGNVYDSGQMPKESFRWLPNILTSLIAGIIFSLIVVLSMRRGMKSVRKEPAASDYVKKGSLVVTESRDFFLYSHVNRTKIQKSSGSSTSRGSSTHRSSLGRSHGGRGGRF